MAAGALIVLVVTVAVLGCSRTSEPEKIGSITLNLHLEPGNGGAVAAAPTQATPDSVVVRVFRGGQGVAREVSTGVAIDGAGPFEITLVCIAENGKKVSVELYENGTMLYFGVDENVDVAANRQTDIVIDALDIKIDLIEVTPGVVMEGASYNVSWSGVPAAGSYLLIESTSPGFEPAATESYLTTDTEMVFQNDAGAYYYLVAAVNPYTVGTPAGAVYGYVQTDGEAAPVVDRIDPAEAPPGALVTVYGTNLDLPGTRVFIGPVPCPVVRATDSQLTFRVSLDANSGPVTLQTLLGTADAPGTFVVDRFAYVSATGQYGDRYAELLAGDPSITSGLARIDVVDVAGRDMTVFDVIVVAHDVSTGPDAETVQAIASSGARVLAVGQGGHALLSVVFPELDAFAVSRESRRSIYVPDGALLLFQSPYPVAPLGPATVEIALTDQVFGGLDADVELLPGFVTVYASRSSQDPESFVLLGAEAVRNQQTISVLYWGHEGDPAALTQTGSECVLNLFHFLSR
jgi:hypothetical protein